MHFGNTVDAVAADNGEIRHFYVAVVPRRHAAHFVAVHPAAVHLRAEAAVDLLYNLVNARQARTEQVNPPAFHRFRHNGVVGVGEHTLHNFPRPIPAVAAFVHHHAHHLRDGKNGMRIVQVDCRKVWQAV